LSTGLIGFEPILRR